VPEGADHDAVDHPFEVLRDIEDRFTLAEVDVSRCEGQGVPAELFHSHRERGTCPE
jgi:hypothetical protein